MPKPIITTTENGYSLSYNGESSEVVPFGIVLEIQLGGQQWLCGVDLPDGADEAGETESMFDQWLYKVTPVNDDDIEFVEDDDDDNEDDDNDDSNADEDEESEVVTE